MNFSDILANLFGNGNSTSEERVVITIKDATPPNRNYINAIKTNRKKARKIYHNTDQNYALAGQLVKPVINNNVNFIGIPKLYGNKKTLKVVEEVSIDYRKAHKDLDIDGDTFIWPQWNNEKKIIELVSVSVDVIQEIFIDPVTKAITGYRLEDTVEYNTPTAINQKIKKVCIVTKDVIITKITGSIEKTIKARNILNVIPIVHFSNDRDSHEQYGHSEIESIEPQLRFYHELTYEAGAAQSRDGHPKLKITTKNPKQWITNNFGEGTYDDIKAGKTNVSMADRDLFINAEGDDVGYLYLNKTTGDYDSLAQTTFSNIVEGSETPEINFGANIGTSLASVKEYRPVWIKKIEAKQYERTQPWLSVYDIIVSIHNFINLKSVKNDITITWPKPNFASVKEQSEIVKAFSTAMDQLNKAGMLTSEEIYNTLKKLGIVELAETYKAHQEVIDKEVAERDKKAKEITSNTEDTSDEESKTDTKNNSSKTEE